MDFVTLRQNQASSFHTLAEANLTNGFYWLDIYGMMSRRISMFSLNLQQVKNISQNIEIFLKDIPNLF